MIHRWQPYADKCQSLRPSGSATRQRVAGNFVDNLWERGHPARLRLKALGEAESIRQKGKAQSEVYRASVETLGAEGYTALQMMQIVGERHVRIVPDVLSGTSGSNGLVEGLLGLMLRNQVTTHANGQES